MSDQKRGKGRPPKSDEISIEEICEIMLKYAANGWFLEQLPAAIYSEKKIKVSQSYLDHLKDEEYLLTKSVAKALCSRWHTEMLLQAAIPSAAWIFICKNVMGWRDQKDVRVEANIDQKTEISTDERKARIEKIKRMAKELDK